MVGAGGALCTPIERDSRRGSRGEIGRNAIGGNRLHNDGDTLLRSFTKEADRRVTTRGKQNRVCVAFVSFEPNTSACKVFVARIASETDSDKRENTVLLLA